MKITIRQIGLSEAPIVQRIYEASPGYFELVDRSQVLPNFAERDILDCVPVERQTPKYEKIFCIISIDGKPVGIIDLHNHHPQIDIMYLGLFILNESSQKQGIGKLCFEASEEFIKTKYQSKKIRLGVAEQNNVEGFWKKMGFNRNGHSYTFKGENFVNDVFEMEKDL